MKLPLTGGCLCGAVRYQITATPKKMGLCHCRSCQRITGSAYWPFLAVLTDSLKITGPFSEYTTIGGSGKGVHRGFCTTCGCSLFGRPEAMAVIRTVSASSLDNPAEFKPEVAVWTDDAQPWDHRDPSLPHFAQNIVAAS